MDARKQAICDALRSWVNQRPGLEFGNYGDVSAYRSEMRRITKQRRDALQLLWAVEFRDSITADDLVEAFERAYSGRLTCTVTPRAYGPGDCPGRPCGSECDHTGAPYAVRLGYCAGQYWPTEYRAAAAAVLAAALWDRKRAERNKPK